MIPLLLLAVMHSGNVAMSPPVYATVYVKRCDGVWQDIYADERMTIHLPNPHLTDHLGNYLYYTDSPYGEVTIVKDGKKTVERSCKIGKR